MVIHSIPEEAARTAVANPIVMIASDGMPITGPKVHPRGQATFSRVLGHYVREEKALDLMTALRKMTLMPAQRLEKRAPMFKDKGRIRVGADADITIGDTSRGPLPIRRTICSVPSQPPAMQADSTKSPPKL